MNITLKAIEEIKLSNTEEKILNCINQKSNKCIHINELNTSVGVIYVTFCNELKKLHNKGIILIDSSLISITEFGFKLLNYRKFKSDILKEFCNDNNIDLNEYELIVKNKNYNNIKLLLGIKNMLNRNK